MAAFQERLDEIEESGVSFVGLSVDKPDISQAFREELDLRFPILADTERAIVREWDRFNRFEMGGIAKPAIFVIDTEMRVRLRVKEKTRSRYGVDELIGFLRSTSRLADFEQPLPGRTMLRIMRLFGR